MHISLEGRREVGALLARALAPHAPQIDALARSLAPEGPGPGVRYLEFADSLASPARQMAWAQRFAGVDDFVALVEAGDPGALIYAFELLARLEPEQTVAAARLAVAWEGWPLLGQALGRALGQCRSREAFRLLIDHPEVPYLRDGLASCAYPGGVDEARDLLAGVELASHALDPVTRTRALPVLSYLLRHEPDQAVARLAPLLDAAHEVSVYAAHALAARDDGRALLCDRLSSAPTGRPLSYGEKVAVRIVLEAGPTTAIDALGGQELLASPEGRPRLLALLDALRADTFHRPHEPSRGWLSSDPRFAALLEPLVRDADRALAALARDLRAKLPRSASASTKASTGASVARRAKPTAARDRVTPGAPSPAMQSEVAALGGRLTRLVEHLRATGYRFAAPRAVLVPPRPHDLRAMARLEKLTPLPPALALVWRTIGGVDLRGEHPGWPKRAHLGFRGNVEPVWTTDPLVIAPAAAVISAALEEHEGPPIALHVAPDALGKAGYSAGTRTLWLPDTADDPKMGGDPGRDETLLGHLRRMLAWGGFAGFEALEGRPEAWLAAARAASA